MREFGSSGSGDGQLLCAKGMTVDAAGNWLVADMNNSRIQAFSRDGRFITVFGQKKNGWPRAVCVDSHGRVLFGGDDKQVQVVGFE